MGATIIFLIGPAASGKSSVGKLLANEYRMTYLDKDIVCNNFTGNMLEEHGFDRGARDGCDYYKDTIMPIEYKTILDIAHTNVQIGNSVILDAPFGAYFNNSNYINELRESYGWNEDIHTIVLRVHVQPEVLKVRMLERNNERDQWKFEHWDEYIASIMATTCEWCGIPKLEYDNSHPLPTGIELCKTLDIKKYF